MSIYGQIQELKKTIDHPLYKVLHDEPNPEMTSFIFRETMMTHLLLWGNSPKDNFFQLNSLTGDLLSNIDEKDYRSDIDAIIFHYHPDFKNLTLDEAIIKYYHMENLDVERERLYKEVLKLQAGKGVTEKEQELLNIFGAIASFGGLGLIAFTLFKKGRKELKEFMDSPSKYMNAIFAGIGAGAKLFAKDPLQFIGTKVLGPISSLLADSISLGGRILNTLGKKIYYNAIEPIVKFVNNNIIQPINKNIVKPIFKRVVKPVLSFAEKKILRPIVQKVVKPTVKFINKKIIQPIKNKVIKPVVKFVGNKIVKPMIKKVIKPVAKYINKKVIKPVYNKVVKPLYKKIVRPVVQPIYRKVVKPATEYVHRNIVNPVIKFVKNKIANPIGKFFKRLWR